MGDTDSLKLIANGHETDLENGVEEYNKIILKLSSNNPHGFGVFDFETDYRYLISLGAKKYLVYLYEDGKWQVEVTVAGLPKHKATAMYNRMLEENYGGDFMELASMAFNHNTLLSASVTGKLNHSDYYSGRSMDNFYHCCSGHDVRSMLNLDDADYYINSTSSPLSACSKNVQIWETVFDNPQDTRKGRIDYDELTHRYLVYGDERGCFGNDKTKKTQTN